jgi:hypothetical protein
VDHPTTSPTSLRRVTLRRLGRFPGAGSDVPRTAPEEPVGPERVDGPAAAQDRPTRGQRLARRRPANDDEAPGDCKLRTIASGASTSRSSRASRASTERADRRLLDQRPLYNNMRRPPRASP